VEGVESDEKQFYVTYRKKKSQGSIKASEKGTNGKNENERRIEGRLRAPRSSCREQEVVRHLTDIPREVPQTTGEELNRKKGDESTGKGGRGDATNTRRTESRGNV